MRASEAIDASDHAGAKKEYALAERWARQAECLIEIVEESDCGRVGGYDTRRGQPDPGATPSHQRLRKRLLWLIEVASPHLRGTP